MAVEINNPQDIINDVSLSHTYVFHLPGPCLDGWVAFQGSCYYFSSDNPRTYADAEQWCTDQESNLASILSRTEQDFVAGKTTNDYQVIIIDMVHFTQFSFEITKMR